MAWLSFRPESTLPSRIDDLGTPGFLEEALMSRSLRRALTFATSSLLVMSAGPAPTSVPAANPQMAFRDINHTLGIYQQNHSLDNPSRRPAGDQRPAHA